MLTYEDIIDAPVAKLKAAVDDWSEMAKKLDTLATDAIDGMKAKADKASWEGVNAGVTKAFIGKTAKEFADAAAEAKGVKLILEEGHAAIKKARDDLVNIRDHEGPRPASAWTATARSRRKARCPRSPRRGTTPTTAIFYGRSSGTSSRGRRGSTASSTTATTPTSPSRTPLRPTSPTARTSTLRRTRSWTRRKPPAPPLWRARAGTSHTPNSSSSTSC